MSVLETIRKRSVILIIAIGASMVIFILEDALTSGRFFFGGNENTVATVNGKKLDYQVLNNNIEETVNLVKASKGGEPLDNQTYNQTVQNEYQQMVAHMVLAPEFKKLGISVSDSELGDLLLGSHPSPEVQQYFTNPQTGRIYDQLVDPKTGGLNMAMVTQYVKQMSDQDANKAQELASWTMLEKQVKEHQLQNKYFNLIAKGIFVTDAEAKEADEDQNKYYNISYVLKKYSDVPDNSITVSDQDIESYYNQHSYEYNQTEEIRKADYVTFIAQPTEKDLSAIKRDVDSLTSSFKNQKPADDSAFIVAESDEHSFDDHFHKKGELDHSIDSIAFASDKGFVYGPYKGDNEYRIAKVLDVAELPDSAKIRIIVLRGTSDDDAKVKALADSLKGILTPENFGEIATKYSQDESAKKGGDIGWTPLSKVSGEFEHACFFSNKGDIKEIKAEKGYLLLLTEDQSPKERFEKVGIVIKKIAPSTETLNDIYSKASSFSGTNSVSEAFEKASEQMNKRILDIKENDPSIAGLESPKEFIRWVYQAKTGDVSGVFDVGGNRYVVGHIIQITPVGTTPLALIKDVVKQKTIEEKKADKLIADLKSAMQGVTSITALGQKAGTPATQARHLAFQQYSIPGLGKEDALLGVMTGVKPQTLSQPFAGQAGVFVIQVDSTGSTANVDYRITEMQQQQAIRNRVQYDAFDALEKKAGLVSHLGKFY